MRRALWLLLSGRRRLAPSAISGLVMHIDASTTGHIYQDTGKTTAVTADGDPIAYAEDATGGGVDLTQSTADYVPVWASPGIGRYGAILFDGSDDVLKKTSGTPRIPWALDTSDSWEVPGGFGNTGLCYDASDGTFWIGDYTDSKIIHCSVTGTKLGEISVTAQPQGVTVDTSDGTLWWGDNSNKAIRHISKSGVSQGDDITLSYAPNGVAYDDVNDSLWVCEDLTRNVHRVACSDGSSEVDLALTTREFGTVDGCHYDSAAGELWLTADNYDMMVRVRASDGYLLDQWCVPACPEGVTTDGTNIYWCDDSGYHLGTPNGNRVYKVAKSALPSRGFTFACVSNPVTVSAVSYIFAIGQETSYIGAAILYDDATTLKVIINDSATQVASTFPVGAGPHVLVIAVDEDAGTCNVWCNEAHLGSMDISALVGQIISTREIGMAGNPNGPLVRNANVKISELAVYDRPLLSSEALALASYWGRKYGL